MSIENGKQSAFPNSSLETAFGSAGLSKREIAAFMAMQGLLANPSFNECTQPHVMANDAVMFADALLKALESEVQNG